MAQGQDGRTARDQDRIQGTWKLVSGQRNGKPMSAELVKTVRLVFKGEKLTTKVRDRANTAIFKLNPGKRPKEIDLDMDGEVGKGIYQLDGDMLKLAHGEVGEPRPAEFPKKESSTLTVMILQRQKP